MIRLNWTELKNQVTVRKTFLHYIERDTYYKIMLIDGYLQVESIIKKTSPANADQIDFETNFKSSSNVRLQDNDGKGRTISRTAATIKGWHYQAHAVEFEVGKKNSIYNKDDDGNDLGFTTIKFFDVNGVDITDQSQLTIDANAKKTVVTWAPTHDFEIVSGSIKQTDVENTDMYLYVNAYALTGLAPPNDFLKVPFTTGGINLKYIGVDEPLCTDGRAPKFFKGSQGEYIEIIVNHDPLAKHKVTLLMELYKDPLS